MKNLIVGIDPGVRNLGIALYDSGSMKVLKTQRYDLSGQSMLQVISSLEDFLGSDIEHVKSLVMERYVAYEGVIGAAAEAILMVIGALTYWAEWHKWEPKLVRAIDWKTVLVHHFKRNEGADIESLNLDKKFSVNVAKLICDKGSDLKGKITDHEADAIGLAFLGHLGFRKQQDKQSEQEK